MMILDKCSYKRTPNALNENLLHLVSDMMFRLNFESLISSYVADTDKCPRLKLTISAQLMDD